jgi:hypothetical protein
MEKQFNNELININNLEQGKTGNADLNNAISNVKEEPLIFSAEEANYLVENVMANDVTSSVIKNTIIIGGTVLLTAVFGWMYYEFNQQPTINQSINTINKSDNSFVSSERNKIKLSTTNGDFSTENTDSKQLIENASNGNVTATNSNQLNIASNNNALVTNNNNASSSESSTLVKNTTTSSNKRNVKSATEDTKKSSSNFSKTIITQRYFDDGSAKMTLEYKNQPVRITINSRGIESLFINSEEVDPSYYYLYDDLAAEAFRRSKIEPLASPTNDANAKPNINSMMAVALTRRGLIKDGENFSFELTPTTAILNNVYLKSDIQKDLLQVYQSAFGSSLPRGGKFIIGKQP